MQLVAKPHPFTHHQKFIGEIPDGQSIAEIVDDIPVNLVIKDMFIVQFDGRIVPKSAWHYTFPKENTTLTIVAVPQGGDGNKGAMAAVAMIALMFAAPMIAGAIGPTLGIAAGTTGMKALTAGITLVGSLLIGALFKPAIADDTSGESYTFSGQSNQVRKNQGIMRLYGEHKVYPDVAALPYTMASGDYDDLYVIYHFGYGFVQIEDLRIGNTPLANYEGVEYNIHHSWTNDVGLRIYPNDVDTQEFSIVLEHDNEGSDTIPDDEWQVLETADDTDWTTLEIAFPEGLIEEEANKDNPQADTVEFCLQYRPMSGGVGVGAWIGFQSLDHSYSAGWNDGKGIADYGDSSGAHEYYADYDKSVILFFQGLYAVYAYYVDIGSTTIPISTSVAIPVDAVITINGVVYTTTSSAPAGSEVRVGITPALQQELRIGTYYLPIGGDLDILEPVWNPVAVSHFVEGSCGFKVRYQTTVPFTAGVTMHYPSRGRYELRIGRVTWYEEGHRFQSNTTVIRNLKSVTVEPPIDSDVPITIMEMKIRASKQLNGVLDNLNALCKAHIPVWNGSDWETKYTSTPAWIYADILRGDSNKHSVEDSRLDLDRLLEWEAMTDLPILEDPIDHTLGYMNAYRSEIVGTEGPGNELAYYEAVGSSAIPVFVTTRPTVGDTIRLAGRPYVILAASTGDEYLDDTHQELNISPPLSHELYLGREFYDGASYVWEGSPVTTSDEEPYLGCNFVHQGDTTVLALLQKVAGCGKASPTIRDSKYSVVFDKEFALPVQMFTQRNASGFSMTMRFIDNPHGIRCKFVDSTEDWQAGEIIAYSDGYDRYDIELNPDPDFDGSATWTVGTGIVVYTTGYAAFDGTNAANGEMSVTVTEAIKAGIRYRVQFEIYDWVSGALAVRLKGEGFTDWIEGGDQFVDVYVVASGDDSILAVMAEAATELKIRNLSVASVGATNIEDLDLFGCTDPNQAWRMGRYHNAQGLLRPETYSFTVDIENIVCERGDRVLIAYDVPSAGGVPTRVRELIEADGEVIGVKTDETHYFETDKEYTVSIRTEVRGQIHTTSVIQGDDAFSLLLGDTGLSDIAIGNLLVFGETEQITADFLVSEIRPAQDLAANLTCVPYAENIRDAERGVMPVYKPLITSNSKNVQPVPVSNLEGSYKIEYAETKVRILFTLTWEITDDSNLDAFQVSWISPFTGLWEVLQETRETTITVEPVINQAMLWSDIILNTTTFGVTAVNYNKSGVPIATSPRVDIFVRDPIDDSTPPANVENFSSEVTGNHITFYWDSMASPFLEKFQLRFQPEEPTYYQLVGDPTFNGLYPQASWTLSDVVNMTVGNNGLQVSGSQSASVTSTIELLLETDGIPFTNKRLFVSVDVKRVTAGSFTITYGSTAGGTVTSSAISTIGKTGWIQLDRPYNYDLDLILTFNSSFDGEITEVFAVEVTENYVAKYNYITEHWWRANILVDSISATETSITVPSRTGTYFIKAKDTNNIWSEDPAKIYINSHQTNKQILVQESQIFPFEGVNKHSVERVVGPTNLRFVYDGDDRFGYYYLPEDFIYDDIFSFNIEQVLTVDRDEGVGLYGTLPDGSVGDYWANREECAGKISVQVRYAYTESLTLADIKSGNTYETLSDLTSLDVELDNDWSEWEDFIKGEYRASRFQFRIKFEKPKDVPQNVAVDWAFQNPNIRDIATGWKFSVGHARAIGTQTGDISFEIPTVTNGFLYFDNLFEVGKQYKFVIDISSYISGTMWISCAGDVSIPFIPSVGRHEVYISPTVPAYALAYLVADSSFAGTIARIRIYNLDPYYSYLSVDKGAIRILLNETTVVGENGLTNSTGTQIISFPKPFIKPPAIAATAVNTIVGTQTTVDVIDITTTGFKAVVWVDSGAGFVATASAVNWSATGYA